MKDKGLLIEIMVENSVYNSGFNETLGIFVRSFLSNEYSLMFNVKIKHKSRVIKMEIFV